MKREHDVHTTKVAFFPQGIPVQKETEKTDSEVEERRGKRNKTLECILRCVLFKANTLWMKQNKIFSYL